MVKPTILLLALVAILLQLVPGLGQMGEDESKERRNVTQAKFPGGPNALFDYLETKMKYPYSSAVEQQEGVVVKLKFTVNEDGTLSGFSVLNKVDDDLEIAAVHILQMMPNWEPARQNGTPIAQAVILPIAFNSQQHYP